MGKRSSKPQSPEQILLRNAERRAAEREAEKRLEWGISIDTLEAAKRSGDEITEFPARPGEREKPPKRLSGLDWLWKKGRITVTQLGAGLKYGDEYRASTDVSIRSAVNFDRLGGDASVSQQRRMEAQDRLKLLRTEALRSHIEMVDLCDMVAGEGIRVRTLAEGDDKATERKEATLIIALDLIAKYCGMLQ